MTEDDWNSCTDDPLRMVQFLCDIGRGSDRKLRLFAVACCRAFWHLLEDNRSRKGVEMSESFADGLVGQMELGIAFTLAFCPVVDFRNWPERASELTCAAYAAWAAHDEPAKGAASLASLYQHGSVMCAAEISPAEMCGLVRCVFGNPFASRQAVAWVDGLVLGLAQSAYEERRLPSGELDNARLAVLADALEDAGCQDENLLSHLRNGQVHVRGCWAVDHVLSRE